MLYSALGGLADVAGGTPKDVYHSRLVQPKRVICAVILDKPSTLDWVYAVTELQDELHIAFDGAFAHIELTDQRLLGHDAAVRDTADNVQA